MIHSPDHLPDLPATPPEPKPGAWVAPSEADIMALIHQRNEKELETIAATLNEEWGDDNHYMTDEDIAEIIAEALADAERWEV